ncbi:MAG: phosphomannomutase/phosphoglucomutase [Alphaproteobacteria bacterium]|nr:phosphomannomutase/phosphoglucomutase [Alphaproteobacteria bacterium]
MYALNPKILREYDIRGTFGKSLTLEDASALGRRFAEMMGDQGFKNVCVGRDGRLSSPVLAEALMKGLIEGGVNVKDIGVGPTPMVYFGVKHLKTDAGIMVTGSHNPPEDNGFKMTLYTRPFFGPDIQGLSKLKGDATKTPGTIEGINIEALYTERLLKDYRPGKNPLKIAIDPGNGAAGRIVELLMQSAKLNGDVFAVNTAIDGNFPAHHPDPTVPENLKELTALVKKENCDLGIAFDGDADRIGVIDGLGRILWGDQLMILWSRDVLKSHPGATIIADVKASQLLFDDINAHGGKALMAKTGHSLIKSKIAETKAMLAGEMSGHIFFADTYYGFDDALYAMIRLLNILHDSDQSLEEIFDQIPKRVNTPEIRIECDDEQKFIIVEKVRDQLTKNKTPLNDVDGVRVNSTDGWWLLRASNTQAILVARCESDSEAGLIRLQEQLGSYLKPFGLTIHS